MKARILVVDDNPANLQLMTYLLDAFNYEVVGVSDASNALNAAAGRPYDLILTDIRMPKMDGYEFALRLRSIPGNEWTPLVAVTALAMVGDRDAALSAGFDGYIEKPIDPKSFHLQVEAFLGYHSRR